MSSRRTGIKSREPIEVYITIDTEFSIGDFDNPAEPHIAEPMVLGFGGKYRVGQILELPVFCYSCRSGIFDRLRALCITACSGAEMIFVLRHAREHGLSPVTILTHSQEYIKKRDFRYTALRQNRVNQTRLKTLLKFLRQHRDDFVTVPISGVSDDGVARRIDRPAVSVSFARAMA